MDWFAIHNRATGHPVSRDWPTDEINGYGPVVRFPSEMVPLTKQYCAVIRIAEPASALCNGIEDRLYVRR